MRAVAMIGPLRAACPSDRLPDAQPAPSFPRAAAPASMRELLAPHMPWRPRLVHAGDLVYAAGETMDDLYVVHAGAIKIVNASVDGRVRPVGLKFRGDWLGFDGIASGVHGCDAIALDTGEIWALHYRTLLQASALHPPLLAELHRQMSRAIIRCQDSMLSLCTLPAGARVAEFLLQWAVSIGGNGPRSARINVHMTRAEIGDQLGMTLESVSRALSGLAAGGIIVFGDVGRREIVVPDLQALERFIQAGADAAAVDPDERRRRIGDAPCAGAPRPASTPLD